MAIVVPYQPNQVENAAIARPQMSGEDSVAVAGERLGKAIQGVGGELSDLAQQALERQNRDAAIEANLTLQNLANDESFVQTSKRKKEVMASPGSEAVIGPNGEVVKPAVPAKQDIHDEGMGSYWQKANAFIATLPSEYQKKEALKLAKEKSISLEMDLLRHKRSEINDYSKEIATTLVRANIDQMALRYNDTNAVEIAAGTVQKAVNDLAQTERWDPTTAALMTKTYLSQGYSAVINRMAADDKMGATAAKAYYDIIKDKGVLTSDDAAGIDKTLKPLVTKQVGLDTALALGKQLGAKSLTEILDQARTQLKSNPDALVFAESQIKAMEQERLAGVKAKQEEAAKPVHDTLAKMIMAGKTPKITDIPTAQWNALVAVDPEEAQKIVEHVKGKWQEEVDRQERKAREARTEAQAVKTAADQAKMLPQLMNAVALQNDPESLRNVNLDKLLVDGAISKTQYPQLAAKQRELIADPEKGRYIRSESTAVNDILEAGKLKPGTEDHALAYDYVENGKAAYMAENKGAAPPRKEVERLAREALYKVDGLRGTIWGSKPAYEVGFDDIPTADREKIIDAFRRRGRAYTEDQIVHAYVTKRSRDVK